jgi:hypothetical protein
MRAGAAVQYSLVDARVVEALDLMRAVLISALAQQAQLAESLA